MTYKTYNTSTPVYLNYHIRPRDMTRPVTCDLLSSMPLLYRPTTRTQFADCAFGCTAPSIWNSLDSYIVDSCSFTILTLDSRLCYSIRLLLSPSKHHPSCSPVPQISSDLWHFTTQTIIIMDYYYFLTPVLNSQGRKIMLCKGKIRKQAGMVFTPPPPSQNYQEVE